MNVRLPRKDLDATPVAAEKKTGEAVVQPVRSGMPGREKLLVCLVAVLYLIVGVGYSLQVPPFEAPDETSHYSFVLRMARGGTLPDMRYEAQGPWSSEGGQAPLYYYTMGYLIRGMDLSDPGVINRPNPHANWGNPQYPGNKNYNLYSGQRLPIAGANLTLHVVRWVSVLLSLGAVLFTYATARLAFPGAHPLAALSALAVALIPQFGFISARVSNDGMVTLLSAATIYCLAVLLKAPDARAIKWAQWAILGILIGLAALTKLQGLALLGPALLVMAWLAWRDRSPGRLACAFPVVIAPLLAIAGWWYWRNYNLYHDWLGISVLVGSSGNPGALPDLRWLLAELNGERMSFWGLFGWFSILLPGWIYISLDLITVVALAGLARVAWRRLARGRLPGGWDGEVLLLLLAWAGILFVLFCYWATFTAEPQGRELDPGLCAIGPLLVAGLAIWLERLPSRRQAELLGLLPAGLAACSLWVLLVLLPVTYLAPGPVAALPADAQRLDLVFDGEIELLGIQLPSTRYHPGESVPVTLYERTRDPLAVDYQVFVQLLGPDGSVIGNVTTYPGWGRNPTPQWKPGAIYPDHYLVAVEGNVGTDSPLLARVYAGFTRSKNLDPATATTKGGGSASLFVGSVVLAPVGRATPESLGLRLGDATFGSCVRLSGYSWPEGSLPRAGGVLPVTLLWVATQPAGQDLTAFVQLLDAQGRLVAGYDQPPAQGRFSTALWLPGDRIVSRFPLKLPSGLAPGAYRLQVGLYPTSSAGSTRLPVAAPDQQTQDQAVILGTVDAQ